MFWSCTKELPFLIAFLSAKDEDLHVNERSREQISLSYGPVRERCALNRGRGIMNANSWRRFPLLLKEHVPAIKLDNL